MAARIGWTLAIWVTATGWAVAQYPNADNAGPPAYQPAPAQQSVAPVDPGPAGQPDQPVVPQDPRLERRTAPPSDQPNTVPPGAVAPGAPAVRQPPPPPFVLTPQQEAEVAQLLQLWEQRSGAVKTFNCKFYRFEYNSVFAQGDGDQPNNVDVGTIHYKAPDKGMFSIDGDARKQGTNPRAEKWVCDGKAVYQYDYQRKQVLEYKLPPEQQGKGIGDGPLPFIFGAKAANLKHRYWICLTTPQDAKGQVWLRVLPKFQQDAANFRQVDLILNAQDMQPFALQMIDPTGKSRTVYQFDRPAVNSNNVGAIFAAPFDARVPFGWQLVPDDAARRSQTPAVGSREPVFAPR